MASEDIVTYTSYGAFAIVTGAFAILFKANRDSISTQKGIIEGLNKQLDRQDIRIEAMSNDKVETDIRVNKEISEQRHELRTLRQKHEIELTRTQILLRYVREAGLEIREEDKRILGIKD